MAEPTVTNESYKVKQVEILTAACIAPLMYSLGAKYTPLKANTWEPSVYDQFENADRWAKDYQVVDFHHDGHDHRHGEYVEYSDMFYSPESDFVEGTPKLLKPVVLDVDGLTKVFDNSKGKDPLHIAYTEEVALQNTVETSVKNSFTFDLTVGSETTVSGSYAGASLGEKLSTEIHTGFSKETGRDESESKTETTSVAVEFDCPAGAIKRVVITKKHQRILIPISGQFVIDFSLEFKLSHWWAKGAPGLRYRGKGQDYFKTESVNGLYQLVRGTDTNYPQMEGFWNDGKACSDVCRTAILHLQDPKNRMYTLDAEKMQVIENAATHSVSDLKSLGEAPANMLTIDLADEKSRMKFAA